MGDILTSWFSKSSDYENFEVGTKDSDSFAVPVASTNEARWVEAIESLLIGTAGDEWKVSSTRLEQAITPTNFTVKLQCSYGAAQIQPLIVNTAIVYIDFVKGQSGRLFLIMPRTGSLRPI